MLLFRQRSCLHNGSSAALGLILCATISVSVSGMQQNMSHSNSTFKRNQLVEALWPQDRRTRRECSESNPTMSSAFNSMVLWSSTTSKRIKCESQCNAARGSAAGTSFHQLRNRLHSLRLRLRLQRPQFLSLQLKDTSSCKGCCSSVCFRNYSGASLRPRWQSRWLHTITKAKRSLHRATRSRFLCSDAKGAVPSSSDDC